MTIQQVTIEDGWYALHAEGSGWTCVEVLGGEVRARIEEANADTHRTARDRFSGIVPSDDDIECPEPVANHITRAVFDGDTHCDMVIVERMAVNE